MTPFEQQRYVMEQLAAQAKESVIVKVLERIAESLEGIREALEGEREPSFGLAALTDPLMFLRGMKEGDALVAALKKSLKEENP